MVFDRLQDGTRMKQVYGARVGPGAGTLRRAKGGLGSDACLRWIPGVGGEQEDF